MTDLITDAELDEWERIEKDATPGPWGFTISHQGDFYGAKLCTYRDHRRLSPLIVGDAPFALREDAEIAALARSVLPRLIAEHRKLRAHIIDTVGKDGLAELLKDD